MLLLVLPFLHLYRTPSRPDVIDYLAIVYRLKIRCIHGHNSPANFQRVPVALAQDGFEFVVVQTVNVAWMSLSRLGTLFEPLEQGLTIRFAQYLNCLKTILTLQRRKLLAGKLLAEVALHNQRLIPL